MAEYIVCLFAGSAPITQGVHSRIFQNSLTAPTCRSVYQGQHPPLFGYHVEQLYELLCVALPLFGLTYPLVVLPSCPVFRFYTSSRDAPNMPHVSYVVGFTLYGALSRGTKALACVSHVLRARV